MLTILTKAPPTLEEVQELVGGWVEMITLDNGDQMLFDEDGKLKGLPINEVATRLARPAIFDQDYIVGHAVVLRDDARWGSED